MDEGSVGLDGVLRTVFNVVEAVPSESYVRQALSLCGQPAGSSIKKPATQLLATQAPRSIAGADLSRGFQPTVGDGTYPRRVSDA